MIAIRMMYDDNLVLKPLKGIYWPQQLQSKGSSADESSLYKDEKEEAPDIRLRSRLKIKNMDLVHEL